MFHLVQPWGHDKYTQATIVSTHATVAEAYAVPVHGRAGNAAQGPAH